MAALMNTSETAEVGEIPPKPDEDDLQEWISQNKLPDELYDILRNEDINNVELLSFCKAEDVDQLLENKNLTFGQKARIKKAFKDLLTKNNEKNVTIQYEKVLLQKLEEQKNLFQEKLNSIPETIESAKQKQEELKKNLDKMFKIFFQQLNNKQQEMHIETDKIYENYVQEIESKKKLYHNKIQNIIKTDNQCQTHWSNDNVNIDDQTIVSIRNIINENKDDIEESDNDKFEEYNKIQQNLQILFLNQINEILKLDDLSSFDDKNTRVDYEEKYFKLQAKHEALAMKHRQKSLQYSHLLREYNEYMEQQQKEMDETHQEIENLRRKYSLNNTEETIHSENKNKNHNGHKSHNSRNSLEIRLNDVSQIHRKKKRKPKIRKRHSLKQPSSSSVLKVRSEITSNDSLSDAPCDGSSGPPSKPKLQRPSSARLSNRNGHLRATKSENSLDVCTLDKHDLNDIEEEEEEEKDGGNDETGVKDDINIALDKPRKRKFKPRRKSKSGMRLKEANRVKRSR